MASCALARPHKFQKIVKAVTRAEINKDKTR